MVGITTPLLMCITTRGRMICTPSRSSRAGRRSEKREVSTVT
jgi:hypothetical protein